ncbi:MAG TPA: hypothetical protein VGQ57_09050 [Polyangiaceae bacterium]|nr:hypothetical protein [Polyangiaceae bacterium]
MFYLFLVVVGILGLGVYVLFIFNLVPGVREERMGVLEALPEDVGKWKTDESSDAARAATKDGLVRETRHYFYEATGKLVFQVRYKRPTTGEIVRVDPEEPVRRKRVRV